MACTTKEKSALSTTNEKEFKLVNELYKKVFENKSIALDSIQIILEKLDRVSIKKTYNKAIFEISKAGFYNKTLSMQLSEFHFLNGINLLKNKPNDSLCDRAYIGLGTINKNKGNFVKALDYFQKSIANCEYNKDTLRLAGAYASIAQLEFEKNDINKARENCSQVFKLLNNKEQEVPYLIALHTLANIEQSEGNLDKAFQIDMKGLNIAKQISFDKIIVTFQDNLARFYLQKNDFKKAEYYFNQNLIIDKKLKNPNWIADTYINLGELFLKQNEFLKAEKFVNDALTILEENKLSNNTLKAYKVLIAISKKNNNYKRAFEIQEKYSDYYSKIINEKKEASFAELDLIFETNKKEKIIAANKIELMKNEIASKRKNTWLILLFCLLVILLFYFKNYQSKSKLQKEQLVLQNQLLEEQSNLRIQEQRLDISRELHDNVGTQLTFIISILDHLNNKKDKVDAEINKKVELLSNFAKKSISELRDTIWVLNSDDLSINELKIRVLNFIKDAGESVDETEFLIDFESANDVELTSKQAINIFRIIQEIINNAIKHAHSKKIQLIFKCVENKIYLEVSDDGVGFNFDALKKKSFGLTNIQNRVNELQGELEVFSNEQGTKFLISIILIND